MKLVLYLGWLVILILYSISYEMKWWTGGVDVRPMDDEVREIKIWKASKRKTKSEIRKEKSVWESNESKCLKRSPDVFFFCVFTLFSFSLTFRDVEAVTSLRLASCFQNVWKQMQQKMELKTKRFWDKVL